MDYIEKIVTILQTLSEETCKQIYCFILAYLE